MQALHLISGNRSCSANSLIPWLLLHYFEISFHEIRIDLLRSDATEKLGMFSPSLKVPVLIHEAIKVWDALPICEYLSETFLEQRGWPINQLKKAAARSVCAELHGDFAYYKEQWPMVCHLHQAGRVDQKLERELARLDAIIYCCRRKYGDGGEFLFGNFSIADAFMAPNAIVLNNYKAELTQQSSAYLAQLLGNVHVQCWLEDAQQELNSVRFARAG